MKRLTRYHALRIGTKRARTADMNEVLETIRQRRDAVTIPVIWIALAVSILIHIVVMWQWVPLIHRPSSDLAERAKTGPLIVQLAPRPAAPPAPQTPQLSAVPQASAPERRPSRPAAPPRPPPVIALPKPAPKSPAPPLRTPSVSPQPATPAPPEGDLASYIESRRRARGASAPAAAPAESAASSGAEDERTRANRVAAANLGLDRTPTFGSQPRRGGGVFDIRRVGYDYAEFAFFGWNKDIRRNTAQVIEVRQGTHPNIRIAIVRRMIAIIREHEQGDFIWESHKLNRSVTLSARVRDTAGLEDFLMREFF